MQVIVKFVCVQVRIVDGVFQVLSKTFLEKFYLLCSLISCLSVHVIVNFAKMSIVYE